MSKKIINEILHFIDEHRLIKPKKHYLLAVSGGMDSMMMCHFFLQQEIKFAIGHCNFNLRAAASDADETLVKNFAAQHQIPFHSITFNTAQFAKEKGISIQMAARSLRYDWLEEIKTQNFYEAIVTAHHSNDNLETILLNLGKGSGISGLRGIVSKNKNIIRPFLSISKDDILHLVKEWNIQYNEDSSNASDKYQRNLIRHQVVPVLTQINPQLLNAVSQQSEYLIAAEHIYKAFIDKTLKRVIHQENGISKASILSFQHQQYGKSLLYEWLSSYGFQSSQINDIVFAYAQKQSGKLFLSPTHQLSCDRKFMYLTSIDTKTFMPLSIEEFTTEIIESNQKRISFSLSDTAPQSFDIANKTVYLDADKVKYLVLIRTWQQGDYMYPLGMKMKKKKLSDLFINQKIPNHQKQELLVFESNNKIFFVEAIRIDERFKITEKTTRFLKISVQ